MGYHVSILRTGKPDNKIHEEEITIILEGRFGFAIEPTESGSIKQLFREISGEDALLFYDDGEL